MKKKGFTLVELLGVIVVLAVIALIAVPTILGIIEKSRKGALKESGNGLVDAGMLYYAEYQNGSTVRFDIKENEITSKEGNILRYKGKIKEGTVLINNKGQVVVCINDGKYAAYKNFKDNKVTIVDNKTCNVPENSTIVYLDNESTVDTNIETLVSEIESLKREVASLKENKIDITTSMNNLTTTHNTDIASVNTKLDKFISDLTPTIDQSRLHEIYIVSSKDGVPSLIPISDQNSYTGLSVTLPSKSYYCITATIYHNYGVPQSISISKKQNENNPVAQDVSGGVSSMNLATTYCGVTKEDTTYYIFAQAATPSDNVVAISGFYIK